MNRNARARTLWGIGDAIVIVVALIPVLWLASLSFKDPATIGDGSFLPRRWTLANYRCSPGPWSTPSASP
jgi:trehalose/maltose transport system permease protein